MSEPITMDREYTTRDGREVRLFTVEGRDLFYPVSGEVWESNSWGNCTWTKTGQIAAGVERERMGDLIPKPVRHKRTLWVNVYPHSEITAYQTKEECESCVWHNRIACIKVELEFQEGEGLDA